MTKIEKEKIIGEFLDLLGIVAQRYNELENIRPYSSKLSYDYFDIEDNEISFIEIGYDGENDKYSFSLDNLYMTDEEWITFIEKKREEYLHRIYDHEQSIKKQKEFELLRLSKELGYKITKE